MHKYITNCTNLKKACNVDTNLRYACCNAIGQMSTDFAPVFEKKFHARVIPGRQIAVDAFFVPHNSFIFSLSLFFY